MIDSPTVLLPHRVPPESEGSPADLMNAIECCLPDVELVLPRNHEDAVERIKTAEIIIEHGYDKVLFGKSRDLRWVQSLSAGHDRYDLTFFDEKDITLTTAAGVHAEPVAEHVIGSLLVFERGFHRAVRRQDRREWNRWTPREISGKTIAIIGVGSIGTRVAELANTHGLTVIGTKRDPTVEIDSVDELYSPGELHTILGLADYVVCTCPLTDETYELFDGLAFASMSSDALFVNVARGEVVDQSALTRALQNGEIRGAVLDVSHEEPLPQNSPLWSLSNVLITPHLAGGSPRNIDRVAAVFAENYRQFVDGEVESMQNRVV